MTVSVRALHLSLFGRSHTEVGNARDVHTALTAQGRRCQSVKAGADAVTLWV